MGWMHITENKLLICRKGNCISVPINGNNLECAALVAPGIGTHTRSRNTYSV